MESEKYLNRKISIVKLKPITRIASHRLNQNLRASKLNTSPIEIPEAIPSPLQLCYGRNKKKENAQQQMDSLRLARSLEFEKLHISTSEEDSDSEKKQKKKKTSRNMVSPSKIGFDLDIQLSKQLQPIRHQQRIKFPTLKININQLHEFRSYLNTPVRLQREIPAKVADIPKNNLEAKVQPVDRFQAEFSLFSNASTPKYRELGLSETSRSPGTKQDDDLLRDEKEDLGKKTDSTQSPPNEPKKLYSSKSQRNIMDKVKHITTASKFKQSIFKYKGLNDQ